MHEEMAVSAINQLRDMTPDDIRGKLAVVLVAGEVLSDEDCERIQMYAEKRLISDPSLSLDDVFMDGAAVRLEMSRAGDKFATVDGEGTVVAYGNDPMKTAGEAQRSVSEGGL